MSKRKIDDYLFTKKSTKTSEENIQSTNNIVTSSFKEENKEKNSPVSMIVSQIKYGIYTQNFYLLLKIHF